MNKNTDRNLDARHLRPIKKFFVAKSRIRIDKKTPEDYGSRKFKDTFSKSNETLQDWLSMPLLASNPNKLNLPDKRTGKGSPKPYVVFDCVYKTNKNDPSIVVSISKSKKHVFVAEYFLDNRTVDNPIFTNKIEPENEHKLLMAGKDRSGSNKNDDNYFLNGKRLFDEYVKNEILTNDSKLKWSSFKKICNKFFKFVSTTCVPDNLENDSDFYLIILPNDKTITHVDYTKKRSNSWTDAAGNRTDDVAEKPTLSAKFVSFDDTSFTPNAMRKEQFYENIGIGYKTLDKIALPRDQEISIAGLQWYFIDTISPNKNFIIAKGGILYQLYNNYKQLQRRSARNYGKLSQMKVICLKMDAMRSKMEALIDENLTMEKLKTIFADINDKTDIPFQSAEILIEKTKSTTLWTDYLKFVNSVLRGYGLNDSTLLEIFTLKTKKAIFDKDNPWYEEENFEYAKEFFNKSETCRKILSNSNGIKTIMNSNEEYAFGIGKIAGRYVWFRNAIEQKNNAVKDVLTYSIYDRIHLRYVLEKIGMGTQVARVKDETDRKSMEKFISDNKPKEGNEISDNDSSKNYAYFFYKGVYSTIAG